MAYVNVRILRCLKEEVNWVINKWLRLIISTRQMLTAPRGEPENACMHACMRDKSCGRVILDMQVICSCYILRSIFPFSVVICYVVVQLS